MMMTHPPCHHQVFIQECKHLNYSLKMMIYISNMKQPANTNFPENNETQSTAQHIFNCNIGGTTGEDVTMEVHQPIEHQPI